MIAKCQQMQRRLRGGRGLGVTWFGGPMGGVIRRLWGHRSAGKEFGNRVMDLFLEGRARSYGSGAVEDADASERYLFLALRAIYRLASQGTLRRGQGRW